MTDWPTNVTVRECAYGRAPGAERVACGLLLCEDPDGGHWTMIVQPEFADQIATAAERRDELLAKGIERLGSFGSIVEGWPGEWRA